MQKHISENKDKIIRLATDFNFWGKRKRDSWLEVCDGVISALNLTQEQLESSTLCDWLLQNKPVKEKAASAKAQKPAASTMVGNDATKRENMEVLPDGVYIVTAAQNNTNAQEVTQQLIQLSKDIGARLLVLPIHYNKNAFSAAVESEDEYFCEQVKPYLLEQDTWLGAKGGVYLAAQAKILPTAAQPVNKAVTINSGEAVTIVPSPKQDMQQIAVMQDKQKRVAWTTGACTQFNYIEGGAGTEAEVKHKFGGLIVTVRNRAVSVRNIQQGDDGSLIDYEVHSPTVDVVLGDLHCEREDKDVTANIQSWLKTMDVRNIALHDILHFETRSHHNRKSGSHLYKMQQLGKTVLDDLKTVTRLVNNYAILAWNKTYLVESNHNSALDNWLDDSSYNVKTDPQNAKLYYMLNGLMCDMIDQGMDQNALEVALMDHGDTLYNMFKTTHLNERVEFGDMDISELWYGVEVSQHGHKGQNGSFGSTQLFGRSGDAMTTGHTHTPAIRGNCFTVGVSASLKQGYNRGGRSSWDHANVVILPNGTQQMVWVNPILF